MGKVPLFRLFVIGWLAAAALASAQQRAQVVDLSWLQAEGQIESYVAPRYIPLAVAAKVEGSVAVYALISPDGSVAATLVVGSIPILDQTTIDAVRKWRFRPITVNGQPVIARAHVVASYYLDESPAVGSLIGVLHDRARECRALLDAKRAMEAERCLSLGDAAAKLPGHRKSERAVAYGLLGEMLVVRGRPKEALEAFDKAIKFGKPTLQEDVALAYRETARIHAAAGDVKKAKQAFEEAEDALRAFQKAVRSAYTNSPAGVQLKQGLDDKCADSLQTVLRELVNYLRQAGRADDAAQVQKRLDRLVIEAARK